LVVFGGAGASAVGSRLIDEVNTARSGAVMECLGMCVPRDITHHDAPFVLFMIERAQDPNRTCSAPGRVVRP